MANTPNPFNEIHWRPTEDFTRIANILVKTPHLSNSAFRLYCYLASYRKSYPSYKRISQDIGIARGTVAKVIKELVQKRLLTYTKGISQHRANEYVLTSPGSWHLKLHCSDDSFPFREYVHRHRRAAEGKEFELVEKLYGVSSEFDPVTDSKNELEGGQDLDPNNTNYQYQYNQDEITKKRVATASDDERLPMDEEHEPDFDGWRDGPHSDDWQGPLEGGKDELELEGNEYAEW